MPGSAAPKVSGDNIRAAIEGKGVKFHIKTGGAKYTAHLQDRAT